MVKSTTISLRIVAESDRFDAADERWTEQTADLFTTLAQEAGVVTREAVGEPGQKGTADSLILTLGSAGAFQAAASCIKAWINRDRTRRIVIKYEIDGKEQSATVSGRALDDKTFDQAVSLICSRLDQDE